MKKREWILATAASLVLAACQLPTKEVPDEENEAPVAVKRFVVAHREVLRELQEVKRVSQATATQAATTQETAQRTLTTLEEMARRHGTGEITVFFPVASARLAGQERERLMRFADFLAREARGRKLLLLSIGGASAFGDQRVNLRLAEKRAEAPVEVLNKYLVNVPHEFHQVYGTGDLYSPKGATMKEHERYQAARVIAVFETTQLPSDLNPPAR